MRLISVLLLVCLPALSSVAQESERPTKLLGLLKPGMYLGVRAFDETDGVKLAVYSPEDFEIALDARTMGLDDLAQKYPNVKRLRDELPPNKEFGEPRIGLSVDQRELLCKMEHVGGDYILVQYGDGFKTRRAFASSFISTIRWHDSDALRFTTSVRHIPKVTERAKL